jgi:cholesterol transport system auxiliary component
MKLIANYIYPMPARALFGLLVLMLSACGSLQPAVRPAVYDFGPGPLAQAATPRMAPLPALALADVQAARALDGTAVLFRLAYSDAQQLRPYAQARWSMPAAELLRQRLREHLGQRRAVLNPADGLGSAEPVRTLRLELDEFSQLFERSDKSVGLLRLRATLSQPGSAGGETLLAQRSFVVQRASPSQDAAGGVRALTAAADAVIEEIDQWTAQIP